MLVNNEYEYYWITKIDIIKKQISTEKDDNECWWIMKIIEINVEE